MYDETTIPTTIYASKVVECSDEAWRGIRFPLEVEVPEAQLSITAPVAGTPAGWASPTRPGRPPSGSAGSGPLSVSWWR